MKVYDNHGIRFEYPADWELELSEDGPRTTVAVQSPAGLAFALVTVDEDRPTPSEMVAEAVAALREEYPSGLDAHPAMDPVAGYEAEGVDLEFVSLDMNNFGSIRSFQASRRTVFVLAQWSDLEGDEAEIALRDLRRSIEETDV